MIKKISLFFTNFCLIIIIAVSVSGCYYDNEEELYKYTQTKCDTSAYKYHADIDPILATYCYSCHGQNTPTSGIALEGYTTITIYLHTDNNLAKFLGSINHTSTKPMPQNMNKLSDCNITKIEKWITAGAQEK